MVGETVDELRDSIKGIDKHLLMTTEQARLLKIELGGLSKFVHGKNYEILARFISGTGAWKVMNKIKATIQTVTQLQTIQERGDLEQAKRTKKLGGLIRAKNEADKVHAAVMKAYNNDNIEGLSEMAEKSDSLTVAMEKYHNGMGKDALKEYAKDIEKAQTQTQEMVDMVVASGEIKISYKEKVENAAMWDNLRKDENFVNKNDKPQSKFRQMEIGSTTIGGLLDKFGGIKEGGTLDKLGNQHIGKHVLKLHYRVLKSEIKDLHKNIGEKALELQEKMTAALMNMWTILKKFLLYGILVVLGITLLVAVVKKLWPSIQRSQESFMNVFGGMIDGMYEMLGIIGSGLMMIFEGITSGRLELVIIGIFQVLIFAIALAFTGLITMLFWVGTYIITGLVSYFTALTFSIEGMKKVIGDILTVIMIIATGIALVAFLFASFPIAIGAAIIAGVAALGKAFWPFAAGGVVNSDMQLVGERGPELVSLPRGSRVHSNADSRRMGGSGGNTINVHVNGRVGASDAEIRDIATKVSREINLRINRTGSAVNNF
tara:strand:- start:827 stop:2461 length:1635 start_codon:yes stop_codon:yes gene_type:complete